MKKAWVFNYVRGTLRFEFSEDVEVNSNISDILNRAETDDYDEIIRETIKNVAKAFASVSFSGSADYDDSRYYDVRKIEFSYETGSLHLVETSYYDDCGYFCPKCGEWIAPAYWEFDSNEVSCDNCDEIIHL